MCIWPIVCIYSTRKQNRCQAEVQVHWRSGTWCMFAEIRAASLISSNTFLNFYTFTRQCLLVLLEADKAKIKGHLLNEIRFSETVPRNPIVVSPAFCLPAFCFLLLGDEAVSLRRRKRICILFLLSHMRPGTPVSVTGHRDSWDWQACKLMEIRLRRNQCNL